MVTKLLSNNIQYETIIENLNRLLVLKRRITWRTIAIGMEEASGTNTIIAVQQPDEFKRPTFKTEQQQAPDLMNHAYFTLRAIEENT